MKGKEPITLSMAWNISPDAISAVGAIDVTLNCDTNLFIDPLLLAEAANAEFRECATEAYEARFSQLISLLAASSVIDDPAWRAARAKLKFNEIPFTHLGYSSGTGGSGFGRGLSGNLLLTAKQVIDLGVKNPDLFVALALFEDGVGADRISDMATNIVFDCLAKFSADSCDRIGVETREFRYRSRSYRLPPNPLNESEPLLLVPKDIVRDLPIASDWASVSAAAQETQDLRDRVNEHIGEIWRAKSRKDKQQVRESVLRSKEAFETLLEVIHNAADEPYDVNNDHRGEIYPAKIRQQIAASLPLDLKLYSNRPLSLDEVDEVVKAILAKFKSLVEDNGLWKEFWDDKQTKPRLEKAMQRLFFAVASAYCDANDLDISPESDAGCGPVDFKVSSGSLAKVLVEIKRSSNPKLVDAYTNQLDAYKKAEGSIRAHYLIIDVGGLTTKKMRGLSEARSSVIAAGLPASEIVIVDGNPQASASKR